MCRIETVLGVSIVLLLAGTSAAVVPPVPYFSQCDSGWSGDRVGGDGPTICAKGCALTSAAMVMAYYGVGTDPERLNDAIGRAGYADQSVAFGEPDDLPIIGDWDGDGDNNIGVYRPGTGEFFMDATLPDVLSSKMIYVDDDDFEDNPSEHKWDTIQEGVDDASDGDVVIVYAGEYVENVDVDKSITLEGAGVVTVTAADAADAADHVFEVTADYVNIRGFTVTEAAAMYHIAGIYLSNANHCNISGNIASNNNYGIYMTSSSNNTLLDNTANSNSFYGICMGHSINNMLQSNNVSNNIYGIYLYC